MEKVFLVIFVSIFFSCHRKESHNSKPVIAGEPITKIKLSNNKADYFVERIHLSEFIDSVKFIKLETTEESLVGSITKVLFVDEKMVIINEMGGEIFLFDNNGNFIRKIANRGRGPGEYLNITSCNYNSERQILSIFSDVASKLLLYNLNGDFIKEVIFKTENGAAIRDIIDLSNGNYLGFNNLLSSMAGNCSGLWEMSSEGKFVRNLFKYDTEALYAHNPYYSNLWRLSDGTIAIRDPMYHDIYHYNEGEIKRYISYELNYDNQLSLTPENINDVKHVRCMTAQEGSNYIISHWIVLPADPELIPLFSLYDKRLNKIRFTEAFDDSEMDAIWPGGLVDSCMDNAVLSMLSGLRIIKLLSENSYSDNVKRALNNLIEGMREDEIENMNPILEILYLKN